MREKDNFVDNYKRSRRVHNKIYLIPDEQLPYQTFRRVLSSLS